MDWTNITEDAEVKQLLEQRKEIENKIKAIDETALIKHELELLSLPDVVSTLKHEDLAVGEQVLVTQTKIVEINCFREDGDIDVEDTTSVFTVGIDEIQKVV